MEMSPSSISKSRAEFIAAATVHNISADLWNSYLVKNERRELLQRWLEERGEKDVNTISQMLKHSKKIPEVQRVSKLQSYFPDLPTDHFVFSCTPFRQRMRYKDSWRERKRLGKEESQIQTIQQAQPSLFTCSPVVARRSRRGDCSKNKATQPQEKSHTATNVEDKLSSPYYMSHESSTANDEEIEVLIRRQLEQEGTDIVLKDASKLSGKTSLQLSYFISDILPFY